MSVEQKLKSLGFKLPEAAKPAGKYVPAVKVTSGTLVFSSGQVPIVEGEVKYRGKVGKELTLEEGRKAAEICGLNCLAAIKTQIGSLDKIERIVKVSGFVSSAPGFNQQPQVVDGASELFLKIFRVNGEHARSAIGVNELPLNVPVEIEIVVKIKE